MAAATPGEPTPRSGPASNKAAGRSGARTRGEGRAGREPLPSCASLIFWHEQRPPPPRCPGGSSPTLPIVQLHLIALKL